MIKEDIPTIFDDIETLYRELDEELLRMGVECKGCGDCCDFDKLGKALCASILEIEYMFAEGRDIPDMGNIRTLKCPYWVDGRCVNRRGRVLGCRVYFCGLEEAKQSVLYEKYNKKLRALADKHSFPWRYVDVLSFMARRVK